MSTPLNEEETTPSSSIADPNNPESNTGPVYTSNHPLMKRTDQTPAQEAQAVSGQNQIPTTAETEQQQAANNTQPQIQQQEPPQVTASASQDQGQQSSDVINATTSSGLTAEQPKEPFDSSDIDATIQGLLIQALALQHNKTQQLKNSLA